MSIKVMMEMIYSFWRPNRYKLAKYILKDGKKHPFALVLPGGGYSMVCSYVEGRPIAEYLNSKGYHAFVLYYRVKKKALYPNPLDDAARALREIFDNAEQWNVDTEGYALFGSSAGGHLAGLFSSTKFVKERYHLPKPATTVLTYPVVTLGELSHDDTRRQFSGGDPKIIHDCSVENRVDEKYPPTYVWCGDIDSIVSPENSKMLAEKLKEYEIPYQFEYFHGVEHGAGIAIGTAAEGWLDHAIAFWSANRK